MKHGPAADASALAAQLEQLQKQFQRLAEQSFDALLLEADERIVFANAAAVALFTATSPDQLLGRALLAHVHPDYQESLRTVLRELHDEDPPLESEARLVRLDGQFVTVKLQATRLVYRGQRAVQWLLRDLSERQRSEAAVNHLAAFARFNPNPVLEFARDGRVIYFNAAAAELARELGHEHPAALLPPDIATLVQTCLATAEKRLRVTATHGGRTFSWSFFPVAPTATVHGYATELTGQLNLENQLRQSQRLESIGKLAAGVAHDFNNVLTVIQGHTGLLRAAAGENPALQESLQQVGRAAERGSRLTSQLLAFSRRHTMHAQPLDLNEVITHFSGLLPRALGEDISVRYDYSPGLPAIFADAGMVQQILMNLGVRARDVMPEGGQLVIGTAPVELLEHAPRHHPEARPGRFICLTVSDTGAGLDEAALEKIFEPLAGAKEGSVGESLGLATVYGIVRQHQGWIEVQSQPGHGTTFKIFFPPAPAASQPAAPRPDAAPARGTETVLVVEDEQPVRWTVRNILEQYGYRVLEAASGVEALAVWHQHRDTIALLLTDMVMPIGVSGQELAQTFKGQKPALKVIFTSGYSIDVAGRGLALRNDVTFLQKPYDPPKLARAVRQCLDG